MWSEKQKKTIKNLFLLSFCYFYLGKCEMISSLCPLLREKSAVVLRCAFNARFAFERGPSVKSAKDESWLWIDRKPASHSSALAPFVCPTIVFIENYYDKRVLASFWAALVDLRGLCRVVGLQKTITFVYFWLISLFNINYSDITRCMSVQRLAKLSDYRATGFFCFFWREIDDKIAPLLQKSIKLGCE